MRPRLLAACAALTCFVAHGAQGAEASRTDHFLALVKERHIPPVTPDSWGRHIGDDCVWVGGSLRVIGRAEVQAVQMNTGKRVEIPPVRANRRAGERRVAAAERH